MEEDLPLLALSSLFVLEFIVPEAFGDWGEVSLEHLKAGFLPGCEQLVHTSMCILR